MKIECEIGEGNRFFKRKLNTYNRLGRSYDTYWAMALQDYIEHQRGASGQGLMHCKRVENNLWLLIREHANIFPLECLYILSLTCALHDCAKNKDLHEGENHAEKGAEIVLRSIVGRYVEKMITAEAIAYIIRFHARGIFLPIEEPFSVGGETPIMLRSCAAIFRLADMMDTSEERTPRFKNIDDHRNFVENVRRSISICEPDAKDKTKIKIIPSEIDIASLNNLREYVEGLNSDLTDAHVKLLKNIQVRHYKKRSCPVLLLK